MNTDSEIQDKILDALTWDVGIDSSRLTVSVRDSIATIAGQVRSVSDKLEARRASQCADGVRAVIIRIEVAPMSTTRFAAGKEGLCNGMTLAAVGD